MKKNYDLTGTRFGSLVALEIIGKQHKHNLWLCRCDCGGLRKASAAHLRMGRIHCCAACGYRHDRARHILAALQIPADQRRRRAMHAALARWRGQNARSDVTRE